MENKTESYIILKPITERFNRIAQSITDDEIKSLIKDELREQIKKCNLGTSVSYLCDEWVESNVDTINDLFRKSLIEKLRR